MNDFWHQLADFLGADLYSQHAICLTNDRLMMVLYTAFHGAIFISYLIIGSSFWFKRQHTFEFSSSAKTMYAAFIVLCSFTHATSVLVIFSGIYRFEVALLGATAATSAVTAGYTFFNVWGHHP